MDKRAIKDGYRPDIQSLRAIAVLLVVFYHSGIDLLPGGYIGVDIFFVISGYLITRLLVREIESSMTVDLTRFYAGRMRRLLPASMLVIVTTLVFVWLLYSPLEVHSFSSSAIFAAGYLSNIWFASLSTDYLADDTGANPFLHTWSLSLEEQFYLVWPAILLAVAKGSQAANLRRRLMIAILLLSAVSFIAAVILTAYNQPWAFFSLPTRAWELGLGGLIALWSPPPYRHPERVKHAFRLTGLTLIAYACVQFNDRTPFPGFAALIPVLGAVLMLASAHRQKIVQDRFHFLFRPAHFIGDISYSLYLWHWPVFVFINRTLDHVDDVQRASGILLSILLAWATYRLIENPVRFNRFISTRTGVSLMAGACLSIASITLAATAQSVSMSRLQTIEQERYLTASQDIPDVYANGCHADFLQIDVPGCVFGNPSSNFTVVLFGDSHAAQWFPALEVIASKNGWSLVSLTKSGCPSVVFEPYNEELGRQYSECTQWREAAFTRIEALQPQLTIIANSSGYLPKTGEAEKDAFVNAWSEGMRQTLARLKQATRALAVLHDTPFPGFNVPNCLSQTESRARRSEERCTFSAENERLDRISRSEAAALAASGAGFGLDMTDAICTDHPCPTMTNEQVIYRDDNHLTASFSRHLAQELNRRLISADPTRNLAGNECSGADCW